MCQVFSSVNMAVSFKSLTCNGFLCISCAFHVHFMCISCAYQVDRRRWCTWRWDEMVGLKRKYVSIRIYTYNSYVMSHVTHLKEVRHLYEWVMSYLWTSRVTHLNESCCTFGWVTSHTKRRGHDVAACVHVTHINESCHTYKWSMPHIWMRPTTHINESCHTYEWVRCHPKRKGHDVAACVHDTHTNESCHKYERVMSRTKRRGHDVAAGVELVQ